MFRSFTTFGSEEPDISVINILRLLQTNLGVGTLDNIESAIREVPGVLGLAAKNLKSGQEIEHKADDIFFTASTFKVPILVELYRQVDAGIIDPDTRIDITEQL